MQNFRMYLCDTCGYSRGQTGMCPNCVVPLSEYTKEVQANYQVDMEEAMRTMSQYKWYI
jgi:hypothetical protein